MLSDNGTNFTGADKALADSFKEVDFERLAYGHSGSASDGVSIRQLPATKVGYSSA